MFSTEKSNRNVLVYEREPGEQLDSFTINMLRSCCPPEVQPIGMEEGGSILRLPTASLVPVEEALQGGDSPFAIMRSLFDAIRSARTSMIPISELLLNIQYLYFSPEKHAIQLLCLPVSGSARYSQPARDLFRSLAAAAVTPATPPSSEILSLLAYVNSPEFTLEGVAKRLEGPSSYAETPSPVPDPPQDGVLTRVRDFLSGEDTRELPDLAAYRTPDDAYALVLRSTGQEFPLGRRALTIGTDPERADILLRCNSFADGEHARISFQRGGYYVEDLHSRSGTRCNGKKVRLWRPERLEPGDILRIGEDELVFGSRRMPR
ncbi:MAG: FHA domain-containing protein [Acutalibacteraceae bacterium]|nr:FHA domain-containing protein [Acutalibacteraceae bacterium]